MSAGVLGWILAYVLWGRPNDAPERVRTGNGRILYELFAHKFYWDELYHYTVYVPAAAGARFGRRFVGAAGVPGAARLPRARLPRRLARPRPSIQTGAVRAYALVLTLGLAGLVVYFLAQAA